MTSSKASDVTTVLLLTDWRDLRSALKSTADAHDPGVAAPAPRAIERIEQALRNPQQGNRQEVGVTLKPSDWRALQALLLPSGKLLKKDPLKEEKERWIGAIHVALENARHGVIVTTGDLSQQYEVVGPVYFQVSNKGFLSNDLERLTNFYANEIQQMRSQGQVASVRIDWSFLYGEYSVGQSYFERAFFVAVQELSRRALFIDADAIIAMRQDIDLDTTGFQHFYLQMYGTAVRIGPTLGVDAVPAA